MILITGDTHGEFNRVEEICLYEETTKDDILIILGDVGINYDGWILDAKKKKYIATLPITLFCIHGNHEERPESTNMYEEVEWHGGTVFVEKDYPNIIFAKDGEIYDLNGQKTIVIGGAYSIDKYSRIACALPWFDDEQPSEHTKRYVEAQLKKNNWKIDVVLSHTAPLKYEPTHVFLPGFNEDYIDKSTEEWLDIIEDRLEYKKWYCAHYHTDELIDKLEIMFETCDYFMGIKNHN